MSRRLTPYLFAGALGVASGVYIFKPFFEEIAATQETRDATGTVKPTDQPQSDATPQGGK